MTIRPATLDDLPAIEDIQGGSSWQPGDYLRYHCLVAVTEGVVAGFLASREIASGEREVLNIVVASACRRRGVARALLEHALAAFPGAWFLEVRASNTAAIRFYESVEFRAVGRRPGYYHNPPEDGIVMRFFS